MTTRSWSSVIQHSNDAQFRAWIGEFADYCDQIGLPRTSDTGQINLLTATRPGANAVAGYEIRQHVEAGLPTIYVKLEYGTANFGSGNPGVWASIGTGTNGSGTLTGQVTDRLPVHRDGAVSLSAKQSYFCRTTNGFGLILHSGGQPDTSPLGNVASLIVDRSVNASGVVTGTGFVVYSGGTLNTYLSANVQAVRTAATAQVFPRNTAGHFTTVVHGLLTQIDGANPIYPHQMPSPSPLPVLGVCSYVTSHIAEHLTFNATIVGSTPRTYMALGARTNFAGAPQTSSNWSLAMLWE